MKEKNENMAQKAKIDPALVAQARTGDQSAFTALYEQTHTALYRSIRSMVHDEDLAWDILQDCYLRAFQSLDKLEADGAFLSWLRRIAVNETARQMSKRLPAAFTELSGDEEDETMPELPDLNPDVQPELALDRQETSRLVREILAELPEQQQLIVGMRYYEDLSVKEIAELLHLTPGTIKTQLHFGRKKVETKVRALEKQGLKLYGLAPFPFLLALLRNLEPGEAAGRMALNSVLAQAPTAAGTAAAGSAASLGGAVCEAEAVKLTAMTAGQAIRHGLAAKLAAGALALCVIGGGIWAGSKALKRESPNVGDERPPLHETFLSIPNDSDDIEQLMNAELPEIKTVAYLENGVNYLVPEGFAAMGEGMTVYVPYPDPSKAEQGINMLWYRIAPKEQLSDWNAWQLSEKQVGLILSVLGYGEDDYSTRNIDDYNAAVQKLLSEKSFSRQVSMEAVCSHVFVDEDSPFAELVKNFAAKDGSGWLCAAKYTLDEANDLVLLGAAVDSQGLMLFDSLARTVASTALRPAVSGYVPVVGVFHYPEPMSDFYKIGVRAVNEADPDKYVYVYKKTEDDSISKDLDNYVLSGVTQDGQIMVYVSKKDDRILLLNDLNNGETVTVKLFDSEYSAEP